MYAISIYAQPCVICPDQHSSEPHNLKAIRFPFISHLHLLIKGAFTLHSYPPNSLLRSRLTSRDRGVPREEQQHFCVRIKGNRNRSFTHSMHSMIDSQAGNHERVCLLPYPHLSWQESLFTTRRSPLSMSTKGRRVHCIWNRNTSRKTTPFQAWLAADADILLHEMRLQVLSLNTLRLLRLK